MRNLAVGVFLVSIFGAANALGGNVLAFTGVNVIPMDEERVLRDQTVIIQNGLIVRIGPSAEVEVPSGARVAGEPGNYLMPGLAEMHAHVPRDVDDEQYRNDVLFLYLANGVTLARGMAGHPTHLEVRRQLAEGRLDGPRLVTAGPGFGSRNVHSPEHGVQRVRQQKEAGYDFLKIWAGVSLENFNAIAAAANASGIRLAGHVPAEVGIHRALEVGYASIDHLDLYMTMLVDPEETEGIDGGFFDYRLAPYASQDRIEQIAIETRDAGVWNAPTETIIYGMFAVDLETVRDDRPEFQYMPPDIVDSWINRIAEARASDDYDQAAGDAFLDVRLRLIKALHDVGAGLLLASDAPQWFNVPGFSAHHEMAVMADAGLTPYEVLKTATVNPAIYLDEADVFGRVAEGLKADLLLLDANPLEDLANARQIVGVVRHGRWFSRAAIDSRLAEIAARNAP